MKISIIYKIFKILLIIKQLKKNFKISIKSKIDLKFLYFHFNIQNLLNIKNIFLYYNMENNVYAKYPVG